MSPTSIRTSLVTLLSAAILSVPTARGQEASEDAGASAGDFDQRVRILERKLEIQEEAAAEKTKTAPTFTAGKEGFSWKSADGAYVLKLRGYVHSDGRFFAGDSLREGTSVLFLRRIRPIFEATVAKSFDVRIMPDWGGGTAVIQDAYIDYRVSPKFRIRTGKFKPPVGFERLMSATEIVFAERALPTNLVPNRDIGFQVSGDLSGGIFNYALGIFDGVADGGSVDTDTNDNKEWAGRLMVQPFKNSMSRLISTLNVGVSGSVGENKGAVASTGLGSVRSPGQQTIFSYRSDGQAAGTVIAQGTRLRWSPQGSWYLDRFGGYGEYVESSQEIRLGTSELEHEIRSWQGTASLVVTNDQLTARGINPKRPLDPSAGGWGAITIDGRYSKLNVMGDAFPTFANPASSVSDAKAWAAGVSWFLNRNVKFVFDYEETKYEGGATPAQGNDREKEKVLFARTQFSF